MRFNRVSELMLRKFPQILRYALAGEKGLFLVRVTLEVVSLLDYRKGFGHIDPRQALMARRK